ncbi:hypothetical protein CEUSTIGMA_g12222.t1 [Chlamydomonas eustigma]|uniref:Uncharacterized protein n=1 Tax=Chlamydomonas eustigma TaxID=1157962 RepID=A0A250XP01_9CHLO|nr:hypothetical protein CEUSTIGMA_g12222.t1 [Chlamydomonas eustigma]|eukprot:GAX84801.1 hypothetical protein CEUSTIGMA_g12222.t1 [Chlamydomonas eustigma]
MRFCEVQDSLSSSDEFTLTTGGCRSEVAALVINQFRDLRDVDSNLVEKLGLSTPCLLPVDGLQERVLDDHEGLSLEPLSDNAGISLSDNADISQQLITNNSNIQATAQAAMAGLVVQPDQVSSLLMLSGIWCMPLLRDRVLHILHTEDHFCGSFARPLAAPLTPSTSSSKVADNNSSPAPSRNVQLLLVQVPQVYVLLGQALAFGLDNADGSISGLRENCMSWMWKWRGRLLGHKGTAEVLGRASYAEVCEAIGAISRTELTPVGTLAALDEWKKLSTGLPQTNIGTHWSAPAASVATAVMAAAMGMLWRSFTTAASSTKFSSFLSSPWSEDIMTGLLDHARENMGVEVCINNLLGWPSTPFGSSCEDYPWGMGQDGIKESVQQLKQLLDSYIVRHGTAILRSEFFKSLPEKQKDRIVAMAQGQMRSGVSQPDAAAGLSFLVPTSQVSKPSRATSAKTPSDSSLTIRATVQRTPSLSSRTTTSASSVKSAGSAAHASQLWSLNNKNAVSSADIHDRNRATPSPGKEAPSVDAAKLKTSVGFTQDYRNAASSSLSVVSRSTALHRNAASLSLSIFSKKTAPAPQHWHNSRSSAQSPAPAIQSSQQLVSSSKSQSNAAPLGSRSTTGTTRSALKTASAITPPAALLPAQGRVSSSLPSASQKRSSTCRSGSSGIKGSSGCETEDSVVPPPSTKVVRGTIPSSVMTPTESEGAVDDMHATSSEGASLCTPPSNGAQGGTTAACNGAVGMPVASD